MNDIKRAACDGWADCALVELDECGGETEVASAIRWYKRDAPPVYAPPCDFGMRFFDPAQRGDPGSRHWIWNLTHSTGFVDASGVCEPETQPDRDGLVAVIDVNRLVRLAPRRAPDFDWGEVSARHLGGVAAWASFELWNRDPCCEFPSTLMSSRCALTQVESTCDVVDVAKYECNLNAPSLQTRVNASHVRLEYVIAASGCNASALFAPFTISVYAYDPLASFLEMQSSSTSEAAHETQPWTSSVIIPLVVILPAAIVSFLHYLHWLREQRTHSHES